MPRPTLAALLLIVVSIPATALANFIANSWRIEAGVSAMDFGYQEFDDGGKLIDREDGVIPGIRGEIAYSDERAAEISVEGSYHGGNVDYDGQTSTGLPLQTTTEEDLADVSVRFAYWFGEGEERRVAPYVGLGYRYWHRDILSTTIGALPISGLSEEYRWGYAVIGIKASLPSLNERVDWTVDLGITRTIDPRIDIDFKGIFDDITLELGERTGIRLSSGFRFRISERSALEIEPYYERWKLGRSPNAVLTKNGLFRGFVFEPYSETKLLGINFTFSHRF